jgi:hypothetical protein
MTDIQIKRRHSGAAGAPTSLKSGQQAWNDMGTTLYIGVGNNGSGMATSIVPIGGSVKADAAAVSAGLAAKANATDVTNSLAAKADLATVNSSLATKANAADVYTKAQADAQLQAVIGAAPAALNTLSEIAAQLLSDESASAALTNAVAAKADAAAVYTKAQVDAAIAASVPAGLDDGLF